MADGGLPFSGPDFLPEPSKSAVVVVDLTRHLEAGGTFARSLAALGVAPDYLLDRVQCEVLPNAQDVVRDLKAEGGTVVFTRPLIESEQAVDWPVAYRRAVISLGLAPCRPGMADFDWLSPLTESLADLVVDKKSVSAFCGTGLARQLRDRGIEHILMMGCTTNFGVGVSAVDAANHGFAVTVVEDACAALTSDAHEQWLAMHALFVARQPTKVVLDHLSA